jgi:hypothetical protein
MKKIYILILALMPLFGWAQPTITNMMNLPVGAYYTTLQDSTMGVTSGNTGANRTWNYGAVLARIPNQQITQSSITPATAPYIDSFPTATMVIRNGTGQYGYYLPSGTNNYLIGNYDSSSISIFIHYPNSEQQSASPINYTNTFTDNFSRYYFTVGYKTEGTGTVTATADAWGSLTTPIGTYPNCLRIFIHQTNVDTFLLNNSVTTSNSYSYVWFDAAHFAPLFEIDSVIVTGSFNSNSYGARHLLTETAGIEEVQNDKTFAMVFPNPNNGQFTLAYHLTTPTAVLQIKDITGRMVHSETLSGTFGNAIINSQNFNEATPAGIYMWEIISNDGVLSQGKISVK